MAPPSTLVSGVLICEMGITVLPPQGQRRSSEITRGKAHGAELMRVGERQTLPATPSACWTGPLLPGKAHEVGDAVSFTRRPFWVKYSLNE